MKRRAARERREARNLVAREAAALLYSGQAAEYIDAKKRAARLLGVNLLPSNAEVALGVERYALEVEGRRYHERIIEMRRDALAAMTVLQNFSPRLMGSTWRGIVTPWSDIDIHVYSEDPHSVFELVRRQLSDGAELEPIDVVKALEAGATHRIHGSSRRGFQLEITVKTEASKRKVGLCEIFRDRNTGLTLSGLRRLLSRQPTKVLVPGGPKRDWLEAIDPEKKS